MNEASKILDSSSESSQTMNSTHGGDDGSSLQSERSADSPSEGSQQNSMFAMGRQFLISVLLAIVLLIGSVSAFLFLASLKQDPQRREPVLKVLTVESFSTRQANLEEIVSAFGTVRSDRQASIAAQVSGEITDTFKLEIGESVMSPQVYLADDGTSKRGSGDIIIQIDPRNYRERVEQAEDLLLEDAAEIERLEQEDKNLSTKLKVQRKSYETFKEEFDRIKTLQERGAFNESDVNQAKLELAKYEDAIVQLETEQALMGPKRRQLERRKTTHKNDLELAKLELERAAVRPPFDGKISDVFVELGQYVRTGDRLFELTDDSIVEVPVPVSLKDFARITARMGPNFWPKVSLSVDNSETSQWAGTVVRVSPKANERTRTVDVYVEVDNREQSTPLLPGTFVNARIQGEQLLDELIIPRSAIVDGHVFVIVEKPASVTSEVNKSPSTSDRNSRNTDKSVSEPETFTTAEKRPIKVDRFLQSLAILTSGLKPGEQIVLTNLDLIGELIQTEEPFRLVVSTDLDLRSQESEQRIRNWRLLPEQPREQKLGNEHQKPTADDKATATSPPEKP